jgi:hypothetical protein
LTLAKETPQFISLYALLANELDPSNQVTYSMKVFLHENFLGSAVWLLLSRVGTRWINEYLPYFDLHRQSLATSAIEIIEMAVAFGTDALVPRELLHALIQLGGNLNSSMTNYVSRLNDLFALCKRLGVLAAHADATKLVMFKDNAMAIFQWASSHAEEIPSEVVRRLTLKGMLRRVQAQALLDRKSIEPGQPWAVPFELKFNDPQLSAVVLDSKLAIWQEGQLMRHCANNYGELCASGHLLMLSLRDASHRHPLATVSFLLKSNAVEIHKFSGFANQRISDQTHALIKECQRQLQKQRRKLAANAVNFKMAA